MCKASDRWRGAQPRAGNVKIIDKMDQTDSKDGGELDSEESNQGAPLKYFKDQFDDEQVLFVFRKHPVVMRRGLIYGLIGPVLGTLPSAIWPEIGFGWFFGGMAIGIAAGGVVFLPWWITWYFSVFVTTDQRFIEIIQKGLFKKKVNDVKLPLVQSVSYELSGMSETLLGFGTIRLRSYIGEIVITQVHHPAKVQKRLSEILKDYAPMPNTYAYEDKATEAD